MQRTVCNVQTGVVTIETIPAEEVAEMISRVPIQDRRKSAIQILRAKTKGRIVAGMVSATLGEPHTYPASDTDQTNLLASYTGAKIKLRAGKIQCVDAAGNIARRYHTSEQITAIAEAMIEFIAEKLDILDTAVAQVQLAQTQDDLDAIMGAF